MITQVTEFPLYNDEDDTIEVRRDTQDMELPVSITIRQFDASTSVWLTVAAVKKLREALKKALPPDDQG